MGDTHTWSQRYVKNHDHLGTFIGWGPPSGCRYVGVAILATVSLQVTLCCGGFSKLASRMGLYLTGI